MTRTTLALKFLTCRPVLLAFPFCTPLTLPFTWMGQVSHFALFCCVTHSVSSVFLHVLTDAPCRLEFRAATMCPENYPKEGAVDVFVIYTCILYAGRGHICQATLVRNMQACGVNLKALIPQ
jgi:hypothetical protein